MSETVRLSNFASIANAVFNSVSANTTAITSITVGGTAVNSTAFPGTANNASNLGGVAAASYQLNSALAANVATMAANSATFANSSATNTFTVGTAAYFVANGNLGVGTATPARRLEVAGSGLFRNGTNDFVEVGADGGAIELCRSAGNAYIDFRNTAGEDFDVRIQAPGTVGDQLIVIGASQLSLIANRTSAIYGGHAFAHPSGVDFYRVASDPSFGLVHFLSDVGGTMTLRAIVRGDGGYQQMSDARFKANITPARSYLNDLAQIGVVTFNWLGDESNQKRLGVIAQQVEQVFPSLVTEVVGNPETGETQKMITMEAFIPMLITAVQELKAKNEALEARIDALQNK